jgi:DNA-binding response OmpR family regulator
MEITSKKTILVVEDEPFVQMLLTDFLEEQDYAVFSANDAQSALALLGAHQEIGLLLTDVGLPGLSGRMLAEAARKLRPTLPVLFATGYGDAHEELQDSLSAGMAIISKPFEMDRLVQAVRALIDGA